jgi:hypothetical protein
MLNLTTKIDVLYNTLNEINLEKIHEISSSLPNAIDYINLEKIHEILSTLLSAIDYINFDLNIDISFTFSAFFIISIDILCTTELLSSFKGPGGKSILDEEQHEIQKQEVIQNQIQVEKQKENKQENRKITLLITFTKNRSLVLPGQRCSHIIYEKEDLSSSTILALNSTSHNQLTVTGRIGTHRKVRTGIYVDIRLPDGTYEDPGTQTIRVGNVRYVGVPC